ncbi:MAG TPA: winged helix-turn-helix domain-containing protein [Candidatus Eisenbacteria bacterium]|nr:winged helix-turn-helix domain-containing protein [Candidatus Eisenbacteria bacterium]
MPELATSRSVIRFGLYEIDLNSQELRKSGVKIKIQEQPFQILALLLERPGEIVTREEIQKRLWAGDTFVDFDLGLNSAVKKLRQALGDESDNPRFVETLYRRGYRFLAPVQGAALQRTLVALSPARHEEESEQELRSSPVVSADSGRTRAKSPKKYLLYLLAPLLLTAGLLAGYALRPPSAPRVTAFRQITHDGLQKYTMATDGERLYVEEYNAGHFDIAQVSAAGGETSVLPTPFTNVMLGGITPDASALLVGESHSTIKQAALWALPLPTGAPHRLGEIAAESVAPSPGGKSLAFANTKGLFLASADGGQVRQILSSKGTPSDLTYSPDGKKLALTLFDPRTGTSAIWEANADGSDLHTVFLNAPEPVYDSSPHWTPDGKFLLFERSTNGQKNIWALPMRPRWFGGHREPVQLTNGPLDFGNPLPSRDGKKIFVVGSHLRSELVRYDSRTGFKPFLGGPSVTDLAFSADGNWITYVTVPDKALWRSRADGTERLQLTDPGKIWAALPRWSPDGKQLVFMGRTVSSNWRAYLISANGESCEDLVPSASAGLDPNWTPDGKSIVLSLNNLGPTGQGISVVDVATRQVTDLPGAENLFSPRVSPNGKTIAAITTSSEHLMLFDVAARRWTEALNMPIGYPAWSRDGQYLYFVSVLSEDPAFFRMRLSDRKMEKVVDLANVHRYWGELAEWVGLGPGDSLLLALDGSNQEVYAIDWKTH